MLCVLRFHRPAATAATACHAPRRRGCRLMTGRAHCVQPPARSALGSLPICLCRLTNTQFALEELEAIVEEAAACGTYVCAHAYTVPAIERAVQCGVRSIEHGNCLDEATAGVGCGWWLAAVLALPGLCACFAPHLAHSCLSQRAVRLAVVMRCPLLSHPAAAELMAQRGTFLVPTLVTYQQLIERGEEAGMAPELVAKVGSLVEQVRLAGWQAVLRSDAWLAASWRAGWQCCAAMRGCLQAARLAGWTVGTQAARWRPCHGYMPLPLLLWLVPLPAQESALVLHPCMQGLSALAVARQKGVTMCYGSDLLGELHGEQLGEFAIRSAVLPPKVRGSRRQEPAAAAVLHLGTRCPALPCPVCLPGSANTRPAHHLGCLPCAA